MTLSSHPGWTGWYQSDLPFTGDFKPDMGRTPNAVEDPTMKAVRQSSGYEMRPEDKK